MDASTAADLPSHPLEMPSWKTVASHAAALVTAILFLTAGVWKITHPFEFSRMAEQLLVPYSVSMPLTLILSISETLAGVLVLVPRFRRWGAWLAIALLLGFMGYIGFNYSTLIGKDCSCFPWMKRAIGPAFFLEDALMMVAAFVAGGWARPSSSKRSAAVVLGVIAVFAAMSYGSAVTHQTGTKAPDAIVVDGQPFSLQHGRVFLFFYDPNCSHCDAAARHMSKYRWKDDVTIIAIPVTAQRFAEAFVRETGIKARTALDWEPLKKLFPFGDPPYGVALENGREIGPVARYDEPEPADTLRKLGFIE